MRLLRGVFDWIWKWSGCPFIVLVTVPVFVLHTRDLARIVYDDMNQCGAKEVWDTYIRKPPSRYAACTIGPGSPPMCVLPSADGVKVYSVPRALVLLDESERTQSHVLYTRPYNVAERGVWAATHREIKFRGILTQPQSPPRQWTDEETNLAMRLAADEYERICATGMYKFRQDWHRWLSKGSTRVVEPIYTGYAHNALALFLLGLTGRGIFNAPAWRRRLRRAHKGRCKKCDYDLTGLPHARCPECGAETPPA